MRRRPRRWATLSTACLGLLPAAFAACRSTPLAGSDAASSSAVSACLPSSSVGLADASASALKLSVSVPSTVPAPSALTAQAPSPSRDGRGLWIWDFERNAPAPERAAALAVKWGVSRVFIKSGNGHDRTRWARNFQPKTLAPFLARGIEVWGFGYFYPGNVPDQDGRRWGTLQAQVEATATITLQPGVTGLVVDAEIEFENKREEARELCRLLRARLPTLKIAYTTFGWLRPHKDFPFEELDAHCGDAFLPQVYWAFGWPGGVRDSLARLTRDRAARGLHAPVWPVQSNERDPAVQDLDLFFRLAGPNASIFYLHPEDTPQTTKLGGVQFRTAPSLEKPSEGKGD